MALLEEWHKIAYNDKADQGELQRFWQHYFLLEKGVYEKLLANPDEAVEGTVKELAEKYELSIMEMTGFLDGINDSLVTPNPIEEMDEDTKVSLAFDKEKLYLSQRPLSGNSHHPDVHGLRTASQPASSSSAHEKEQTNLSSAPN